MKRYGTPPISVPVKCLRASKNGAIGAVAAERSALLITLTTQSL